jgi:hypothetical protein
VLRAERKAHRDAERRERLGLPAIDGREVIIDANWTYVRSGLAYGEAPYVNAIRYRQAIARAIAAHDQSGGIDQAAD